MKSTSVQYLPSHVPLLLVNISDTNNLNIDRATVTLFTRILKIVSVRMSHKKPIALKPVIA